MNFTVVGAGAWGTAFALHLVRAGQVATLVPRRAEQARALADSRENADYLPGVRLPAELNVTSDLAEALRTTDVVLLACPSQSLRETTARIGRDTPARRPQMLVSLAKGLELGTHLRPSEVMASVYGGGLVGSLTGPTNAGEVALGKPSAMVLAGSTGGGERLQEIQAAISGATLRVYTSDDLAGVEFGGCLKNIYAIAAGCCDGLRLGDNAKAALLTRALAEMVRVGTGLGARAETFYGLSGFGDLVATCHGEWSRNRQFGEQIGQGKTVAELLAHRKTVVEGYKTAEAFGGLCAARQIEAPILREVQAILFEGKSPAKALSALMTRGLKAEVR